MEYGSKTFTENDKTEIAISYKTAKDRNEQIKILAELNACDTKSIKAVLEEKGLLNSDSITRKQPKKKRAESTVWTDEMDEVLINMYLAQVRQQEIADKLGISRNAVVARVRKLRYRLQDLKSKGVTQISTKEDAKPEPPIVDQLSKYKRECKVLLGLLGTCIGFLNDYKAYLESNTYNKTPEELYLLGIQSGKKISEIDIFMERLDTIVH